MPTPAQPGEEHADGPGPDQGGEALKPGDMVGEYRVDGVLAEGTYGTVYAAEHPIIGKRAAIKVLHAAHSTRSDVVSRFVTEARAVNQIRHPNIVDVFSIGKLDAGQPYFVMERLDGVTLTEYLEDGALELAAAYPIIKGVALALGAAHDEGIVHRDLKPDNVFVAIAKDGLITPKLLDFGVAKLVGEHELLANGKHKTKSGVALGTPLYMAPEQCRGQDVDARTDLYALGAVIHQMLTGAVPLDAETTVEVMYRHINDRPPPMSTCRDSLPAALDEPVLRMLAKSPDDRPASAAEALRELIAAAREVGLAVDKSTVPPVDTLVDEAPPVEDPSDRTLVDEGADTVVTDRGEVLDTGEIALGGSSTTTVSVPPPSRPRRWLVLPAALVVLAAAWSLSGEPSPTPNPEPAAGASSTTAGPSTAATAPPAAVTASTPPSAAVEAAPTASATTAPTAATKPPTSHKPPKSKATPPPAPAPAPASTGRSQAELDRLMDRRD